ncbi:hypothetical protein ANCDUO_07405 [Ancylostoma duodenale]|uniref:Uncharacterized protein n=1 Tax=Ancylostoma duodenale TaxID=51022 RepID=A0A0C2GYW3_9BILA|nr:hypothetical protein ANCDUO_07405 [Ancylostoma duodenale]
MCPNDNRWTRAATGLHGTLSAQQEDQQESAQQEDLVRLLHEFLQGKIQCSSCPSCEQNPLDNSRSREGQTEGLLAPARYIRRSTGVKAKLSIYYKRKEADTSTKVLAIVGYNLSPFSGRKRTLQR